MRSKIYLLPIVSFFLLLLPLTANAQKDAEATIKSLAPLIMEYHGQIRMEKTDILRNITRAYEHNPYMLTAIAKMFYDAQDSAVAHQYEAKALKADPQYSQAYVLRGDANLNLYQDTVAAVECYEKATTVAPSNPAGYEALVNYYLKKRNSLDSLQAYNLAELYVKNAVSDDDKMAAVGMINRVGGNRDTSISLLESISFDKMKESQLARYSYLLCSNNMTDRCQEVLDKGLADFPQNSYLYRVAMYNYAHAGSYELAEEMGDKLFEMVPEDSLVTEDYRIYSYCLTNRGETAKAVESLWKAIEVTNPNWATKQVVLSRIEEIYINKAESYVFQKNYEEAAKVYESSIKDFFNHNEEYRAVQTYANLGNFYTKTWAEELEGTDKLVPYHKVLEMYKDMTNRCSEEDYKTSGLYRQCFIAYYINRLSPDESVEPYCKKYIERVLSHDKMGYYDRHITTVLQILSTSNPTLALSYANKFQAKYPDYINKDFDSIVDKLSK